MQANAKNTIYTELGITPIINAIGHRTILGGSCLSPRVRAAQEEANRYFVNMAELLEKSGKIVAKLLDAEAAYITTGASAALALGTAACIAGTDSHKIGRLPNINGPKSEVIIQCLHRYKYDRCPTIVGARLREVGDIHGTTTSQIKDAISSSTAAILFPAHLDGKLGTVSLVEVITISKQYEVPILIDAAFQIYPTERMKSYTQMGADLVCFAAKYFDGPNAAGILCGQKNLVASASLHDFVNFETSDNHSFGRLMKIDRQEVIAAVVALQDWMQMDHQARLRNYDLKIKVVVEALQGLPDITLEIRLIENTGKKVLSIKIDPGTGRSVAEVAATLRSGNPSIWVDIDNNEMLISMSTVHDGDELIIATRLKDLLG